MAAMPNRLRAWLQLVRLPAVFTAIADPLAGWFIIGGRWTAELGWLLGASACFYMAGMVFNDCFDIERDRQHRPERPLPSGAVPAKAAWIAAGTLLATGLTLTGIVGYRCLFFGGALSALILLYNARAKHTILGPFVLGGCRVLNMMLGLGTFLWPAAVLGAYVTGLSFVARREEVEAHLRVTVKWLLLGIVALDAILVLVVTGNMREAAIVLLLVYPAFRLSGLLKIT